MPDPNLARTDALTSLGLCRGAFPDSSTFIAIFITELSFHTRTYTQGNELPRVFAEGVRLFSSLYESVLLGAASESGSHSDCSCENTRESGRDKCIGSAACAKKRAKATLGRVSALDVKTRSRARPCSTRCNASLSWRPGTDDVLSRFYAVVSLPGPAIILSAVLAQ